VAADPTVRRTNADVAAMDSASSETIANSMPNPAGTAA
jgi:hypothetical protein